MIVPRAIAVAVGSGLTAAVLISALQTVVLPRQRFTRIARALFAISDRVFVHPERNSATAESLRSLYAPLALVTLPLIWMMVVTMGFSFIFWGIGTGSAQRSFEVSGSSLFTLGFAEPTGGTRIWLTFVEATIGLGLVALLIGYLPTVYAAYREREKGVTVLRPFAGTPPSPFEFLKRVHRTGIVEDSSLWRSASSWLLEVDQSHADFPALSFFPESSKERSWVASAGCILDAAAILVSTSDVTTEERPPEEIRGPMLVLAYGVPCVGRIGRSAGLPLEATPSFADLISRFSEPPPDVSISSEEYFDALERLDPLLLVPAADRPRCWQRYAWIRSSYDRPLCALAGLTSATSAPWSTDRPATVGRPRALTSRPILVEWTHGPVGTRPVDRGR
ncbi:MAG: hypothetical protein ACYCVN_04280 [Acidimicrobiales bacterium]